MDELQKLYQEVIIDHSHHPRNCRAIKNADHVCEGYNPLCGDKMTLFVKVKDGVIEDISFEGEGCAIFLASASMMTEIVKGKKIEDIKEIYHSFHVLVTSGANKEDKTNLGKLAVFSGVSEFPIRVKCATLPWHTLKNMFAKEDLDKEKK